MLIVNFSHPITNDQIIQIASLANTTVSDIRTIPVQIDQTQPLEQQIRETVDAVGLTPEEWQTLPLLVNPRGYAPAAFVLLAELHGRIGHFPTLIRLRPKAGPITSFEAAELLNLQTVREHARKQRSRP